MITLNPNPKLVTNNHSIPVEKKKCENPAQKILPLASIYNINAILSKESNAPTHSTALEHKIQCVENRLSAAPTLNEKRHLYKTYAHYGNTPTDCHADLNALDAALLNTEIKHSRHIALLRNQLAALNLMAETLLTPDSRTALTPAQLAEVNLRENIIRALIASASFLPDILLCSERIKNTLSIRNTLIDELIQGALRRLAGASPSAETELRALLHAPPLSLHEKFERFITDSQTALMKPLHKELGKHIQIIKQSAAAARRFLNSPPAEPGLFPPVSTDTLYAIRAVAEYLETLIAQLRPSIQPDAENRKIQKKYHSWLSPHGIEPAVPAAGLVHTLHRGLNNTASALEKLHRHINRERLSPFPATALKSFLSLSYDDRIQCLMLKKMAMPIQDNADKLQRAAADLHSAIRTALPENGYPLFFPATPEAALRTELTLLTEETPHSTLLLAAEAARTVAQQVLNTSYPLHTPAPAYAKFSAVVQEYSDELRQSARLLKNAVRQTEINFRQKSILSAIHNAHKTAHDIKHILSNALESVSGVARNSGVPWLRKLDIDLHTHWQGITALSEKGRNNYILCGQGQQGMAPAAHIQYAVLPLLNEAEKLRGACRSLEMTLGSPANQDAAEKTADTIKNSSLAGIIQAEHTIHNMLSEKNKAVYLCCKSGMPDPVSLKNTLQIEARALLSTARRLQETAWLLSWNADDAAVRQSLVHIRGSLRSIKKRIKDAVETATGVRPHINSTEGMIAKDAAEWLTTLKEPPDGKTQNDMITALTDRLCEEFISQHDPEGALFRLRITLALRDAEQGTLIWPLTPQEHLNTVKTPRDYTLAWAEKRLTYSMLYNCLVHYTPAALFSLSRVKNTLVSPLRLINLLLTPVRMAVTRRAMQKVRPGSAAPAELIAEYTAREMYQAIFRTVSLLSPQLFKTVAATGITAYGLMQGGEYRRAFLTRAAARLPGDLFWVGGFAAWHQAVTVFHALRQQEALPTEQSKRLQEILNLSAAHAEDTPLPPQINSRATRSLAERTSYPEKNEVTPASDKKWVTDRLLNASKRWKDFSAVRWVGLKETPPWEGEIFTVSGDNYMYLRGLYWKITSFSEDTVFILAETLDDESIICKVTCINNVWDLTACQFANRVTNRLLNASKRWKDFSAVKWVGLKETPPWEGEIFTVSGDNYIYLRGLYWKITSFSKNQIFILAETDTGLIACKVIRINNTWDLAESEIESNQNRFISNFIETSSGEENTSLIKIEKKWGGNKEKSSNNENKVTDRLIKASKRWKNLSTSKLIAAQNALDMQNGIHSISGKKYIYLQGVPWEIFQTSEDNIFIITENDDHKIITHEAKRINNRWDLDESEITKIQSADITQTQLDKNLTSIKLYYDRNELKKHNVDETSLRWWLNTEWKNRESLIPALSNQNFDGNIILHGDKKYLTLYSHTWEYDYKDSTTQGILKDRFGNKINIININGKWYLNGWEQQKKYLYTIINGLHTLSETNNIKINDILRKTFQNNPNIPQEDAIKIADTTISLSEQNEISIYNILSLIFKSNPELMPEDAIKIADTALSVLLFQNIENKQYVNNILEIKYLLMLAIPDIINKIINTQHIEIIQRLGISVQLKALKKNLSQLYATEIDTKNYNNALKTHHLPYQTLTTDKNDIYYKGIAYCNDLISRSSHKDNRVIFNEILFFLTKKELMLSSKNMITEEENEELSCLNIAKYHLYAASKYLALYDTIIDPIANTRFSGDKNILFVLKKVKIDAVKIYYLNQENLSKKEIHLSDDEALHEYANIVSLRNEASEYLDMIASVLFYQIYHPKEEFTAFDFIKAKLYYEQRTENLVKEIYTFDTKIPSEFISYEDFLPSKNFSSRRDYTQQFNDYIDKGSSEYESKLLTPLLLGQLNINPEDLLLPPRRWFTLKLICYDYIRAPRWPERKVTEWPEELNMIQLHNGDYITISEINGNMAINVIKEENYNFHIKKGFNKKIYLHTHSYTHFLNMLIGPLPSTQKTSQEYVLKFHKEKEIPSLTKTAVQKSLRNCLDTIAKYQKKALEEPGLFTQKTLEILVPFYKEFYNHLTDSHYTMNKSSLIIDFILTCFTLRDLNLSLESLKEVTQTNIMRSFKEGINKGLSRSALSNLVSKKFFKTSTYISSSLAQSELTQIISPVSSQQLIAKTIRWENKIIPPKPKRLKFPSPVSAQHNITLGKYGEFNRYKGIYTVAPTQMGDEVSYFIKNQNQIYRVRWDKNKYTWRLIENQRPMGTNYGTPIRYLSPDKWTYNINIGLQGGGIETQDVITKAEQTVSDANASRTPLRRSENINPSKNIFTSENLLTDDAAIAEISKALNKAQKNSLEITSNAITVIKNKSFFARAKELIRIFTNRNDEENFLIMLGTLKKALKDLNVEKDIKLVNVEDSTVLAQISPRSHSIEKSKYLAVNYSRYNQYKEMLFTESAQITENIKKQHTNDNFARVLIHEFTHAESVAESTDDAGYVEILQLNGKHDATKLLLKAKLGLPEVRNNADSLTEIITILAKTNSSEFFLDDFLEKYQEWEREVEIRMHELDENVKSIVADRTQLSWETTARLDLRKLKEEYNLEMCNQLISEINEDNKIFFDTNKPLSHSFSLSCIAGEAKFCN